MLIRYHEGCCSILTVGRWSWKSEPAKECVITHLPNGVAPKMDGAEACDVDNVCAAKYMRCSVGGREDCIDYEL